MTGLSDRELVTGADEQASSPELPSAAAAVVAALRARRQTVATAESLTGGLVGAALTDVAGASAVYRGGLIVYATELKAVLAQVSAGTLTADGPVAATTAAELAEGAAAVCGADWGLATTGVAGPDPQDGHPVGQVFVAVAGPLPGEASLPVAGSHAVADPRATATDGDPDRRTLVRELTLTGDRAAIRDRTTEAVLRLLLEVFETDPTVGPAASSGSGI